MSISKQMISKIELIHIIKLILIVFIIFIILSFIIKYNNHEIFDNEPSTTQPDDNDNNNTTTTPIDRTKLYGSLFLDKLDEVIKNMTDPDIKYESKRIELNKYSDILL